MISDPIQARHILRDANTNYDKGVLAEILEPIMGKGLIPAGKYRPEFQQPSTGKHASYFDFLRFRQIQRLGLLAADKLYRHSTK